jgi:hypothetical protein
MHGEDSWLVQGSFAGHGGGQVNTFETALTLSFMARNAYGWSALRILLTAIITVGCGLE